MAVSKKTNLVWIGAAVLETLILALAIFGPWGAVQKWTFFGCGSVLIWVIAFVAHRGLVGNDDAVRLSGAWESSPLPSHSRGILGAFQIIHGGGIGSIGTRWPPGDHELFWPTDGPIQLRAIRCDITNYSETPLANVELVFGVVFRAAVRRANFAVVGGNQWFGGAVVVSGEWAIVIPKIDPGSTNASVFYIYHTNEEFLHVTFPKTATAETLNDQRRIAVTLARQRFSERILPPVTDLKP